MLASSYVLPAAPELWRDPAFLLWEQERRHYDTALFTPKNISNTPHLLPGFQTFVGKDHHHHRISIIISTCGPWLHNLGFCCSSTCTSPSDVISVQHRCFPLGSLRHLAVSGKPTKLSACSSYLHLHCGHQCPSNSNQAPTSDVPGKVPSQLVLHMKCAKLCVWLKLLQECPGQAFL